MLNTRGVETVQKSEGKSIATTHKCDVLAHLVVVALFVERLLGCGYLRVHWGGVVAVPSAVLDLERVHHLAPRALGLREIPQVDPARVIVTHIGAEELAVLPHMQRVAKRVT